MSQYAKAIVAAAVGVLVTVANVWQAAVTDGEITSAEWQLIITTAIGAVLAAVGVYAKANAPKPPPSPDPVPAPPAV